MSTISNSELQAYLKTHNRISDRAELILKTFGLKSSSFERVLFGDDMAEIQYGWSACGEWTNDSQEISIEAFVCGENDVAFLVSVQQDKQRKEADKFVEEQKEERRKSEIRELERLRALYPDKN